MKYQLWRIESKSKYHHLNHRWLIQGGGLGGTNEISMFFFDSVPEVSMAAALVSLFLRLLSHTWIAWGWVSTLRSKVQKGVLRLNRQRLKCMCQKLKSCSDCSSWILFSPVSHSETRQTSVTLWFSYKCCPAECVLSFTSERAWGTDPCSCSAHSAAPTQLKLFR